MPMGPAARLTDGGIHGGVIVGPGAPMVLIGNLPAARVTNNHVCPMVTGVVPHVGGPIILGSFGVLTMCLPQARLMDPMVCVGPPDMIRPPCCLTVIVGEMMPGAPVMPAMVVLAPMMGATAGAGGMGVAAGAGGTTMSPSAAGAAGAAATAGTVPVGAVTNSPYGPGAAGTAAAATMSAAKEAAAPFVEKCPLQH